MMASASPIRVLRIIPVLDFGGVESLLLTQATHWAAQDIHVDYLTFWKDGHIADALRAQGATVHVLGIDPSIRNPKATLALRKFLKEHPFDILHSVIGEANFHTMLCAPLGKYKVLINEDGIPNRTLRNRIIYAGLYRLVDEIVAVSEASKDYVEDEEWAPEQRTHLIYNAISEDFYSVERTRAYTPDHVRFRAIGRLDAVKNFDGLIQNFAQVAQKYPHIHLDIAGDGPERANLEAQIHALQMDERIHILGFCDNIPELHQDSDWLLAPSHREGFGLVAAEAMAAGVPVIASNAGGLPEVLGDLANKWTFEPTDDAQWIAAIERAATYPANAYHALRERMRDEAKAFHPTRYVESLAILYRDVIGT